MIQRVFRQPNWGKRFTIENQRGLTPLVWNHRNPYGQFRLDRNTRLVIAEVQAAVRQVTTLHFLPRVLGLPQYATCRYMKISPENQSRLISDEEIKTAF